MARKRSPRPLIKRHWLIWALLSILALLLYQLWPEGGEPQRKAEQQQGWQPPSPLAEPLFEDFSTMPVQGPPARLVPPPIPKPKRQRTHARRGIIALIIDDIGYDLRTERALLQLPFPLAISVLPQAPHAEKAAQLAHRASRIVMLHLPMEPSNPDLRRHLDESFLRSGMSASQLRNHFSHALQRVPLAQGVNNHMGSLLTTDRSAMRVIMDLCHQHQLFFVDSRTGADSVAASEAKRARLRWAERQVFLDHRDDRAAIAKAWHHAELIADRYGSCVVIAHPRRRTLAFLKSLGGKSTQRIRPITALLQ